MQRLLLGIFCCMILACSNISHAAAMWTDWTAATNGQPGSASGTLATTGGPVAVTYAGEVLFANTNGGDNYWAAPYNTPYLSAVVPNEPPTSDIVTLVGGNAIVNTLTFSEPLVNPVMGIVSLGTSATNVQYAFDTPFHVLSFAPGYWGGPGTLTELPGNVLQGSEGHGVIQFEGTVSSISWTVPTPETFHGFTIGLGVVPEPPSLCLLGMAAAGFKCRRHRKRG